MIKLVNRHRSDGGDNYFGNWSWWDCEFSENMTFGEFIKEWLENNPKDSGIIYLPSENRLYHRGLISGESFSEEKLKRQIKNARVYHEAWTDDYDIHIYLKKETKNENS